MPGPDLAAVEAVTARDAVLTKPPGSLGRLEEIVAWLAAWQGQGAAGDQSAGGGDLRRQSRRHRPRRLGLSAAVTQQMVENFARGGAAINQICLANDLGLKVLDLALEVPTGDITAEAAMDEADCARTMAFGMEAVAGGTDLLCIGEMGIGNTTIAAAIFAALFGGPASDWVGPGHGVDDEGLARKRAAVEAALAFHQRPPVATRSRCSAGVGGRELAAMAGAIVAARHQRVPVIVDGYVATAAAAVLFAMDQGAVDHCLFGHVSAEPGHRRALARMDKTPLLDLGMRLGEGTGAALAAGIVKAAARTHAGMATFAEAGVSDKAEGA